MPLFECSECEAIENTALCNYWLQAAEKKDPLCSECDPEIGKWHAEFEKETAVEAGLEKGKDGFFYDP